MPKIKFYHIRTLLWTYLVWAALMLWAAFKCCSIANRALAWMAYYWAMLHIAPLCVLIGSCWHGAWGAPFIISGAATLVAGFAVVAGLLVKGWWARLLIIMGISVWFSLAFFILTVGA
jgi:hypothetical protein